MGSARKTNRDASPGLPMETENRMTAEIVAQPTEMAALTPASMPKLMELAVEKGGVEALEKLVAMHERMMAAGAAREFAAAMASFQEECPPIRKTSTAKVTTKAGGAYTYQYAELDEIARTVRPFLHKHGLAYSWDCKLSDDGAKIRVECTLSHVNGHKASASFESPTAPLTNSMSKQQEVAAALTFGKRQTLIQVLGLTTCDPDIDGTREPAPTITPDQVLVLMALLEQRPPASMDRLLEWTRENWGASTLDDIPAAQFEWLKADLEKKIKAQR